MPTGVQVLRMRKRVATAAELSGVVILDHPARERVRNGPNFSTRSCAQDTSKIYSYSLFCINI